MWEFHNTECKDRSDCHHRLTMYTHACTVRHCGKMTVSYLTWIFDEYQAEYHPYHTVNVQNENVMRKEE